MRTFRVNSCILFFVILAIASCKKSTPSAPIYLIGIWKFTSVANDDNHNGIMDASEVTSILDTVSAHILMTYNEDGTFIQTYYSSIERGTWAYEYNNTYLKEITHGNIYQYKIDNLTSSIFTIRDTSGGKTSWTISTKQ